MSQVPTPMDRPAEPSAGLVATCLKGLSTATRANHHRDYKAFMRFLGVASPEQALRDLISRTPDEAERLLNDFRTFELARGRSQQVTEERVSAIRRAVRKANEAGLTDLVLNEPTSLTVAPYDLPGLTATCLEGLSARGRWKHFGRYKAFMRFRGAASTDDALRDLISRTPDDVARLLTEFQDFELGLDRSSEHTTYLKVSAIRRAVRKANEAGLTDLVLNEPVGLTRACLEGLSATTKKRYLGQYKAFARFRKMSTDDALRDLFDRTPNEAEGVLDEFEAHRKAPGLGSETVDGSVSALRTAVVRARRKGLTDLILNGPPYDPPGLARICLEGLRRTTGKTHYEYYEAFARFLEAASVDDALRDLFDRTPDEAEGLLNEFAAHRKASGSHPSMVARAVAALRLAARTTRNAGKTAPILDGQFDPPHAPDEPGGLTRACLEGLSDTTKTLYLVAYRAFMKFRQMVSPEKALRDLISRTPDDVERLLTEFQDFELARGRSQQVMEARVRAVRRAVRKAREAGERALILDDSARPNVVIGRDDVLRVGGKPHHLRNSQYAVVAALVSAGPKGLHLRELRKYSLNAAGILRQLHKFDRVLGPFIELAGKKGLPYRIIEC